jgi:hypothetical protein
MVGIAHTLNWWIDMIDKLLPYITDPLFMSLLGLLTHFLKDMARIHKEECRFISLRGYWIEHPYQSIFCLIGMIIGLVILHSMNELSSLNAFGVGYMSNSIADTAGKRAGGKINA